MSFVRIRSIDIIEVDHDEILKLLGVLSKLSHRNLNDMGIDDTDVKVLFDFKDFLSRIKK